jgi:hypothetical protein
MGDSSSSITGTTAHTHTATSSDGGSLSLGSTTIGATAGSILYSDGSDLNQLAIGSDNQVLKINGTALNWETLSTPSAGLTTLSSSQATINAGFSTTSGSYVDVTGLSFALPNRTGGKALLIGAFTGRCAVSTNFALFRLYNTTDSSSLQMTAVYGSYKASSSVTNVVDTDGDTIQLQVASDVGGDTSEVTANTAWLDSRIQAFEVS